MGQIWSSELEAACWDDEPRPTLFCLLRLPPPPPTQRSRGGRGGHQSGLAWTLAAPPALPALNKAPRSCRNPGVITMQSGGALVVKTWRRCPFPPAEAALPLPPPLFPPPRTNWLRDTDHIPQFVSLGNKTFGGGNDGSRGGNGARRGPMKTDGGNGPDVAVLVVQVVVGESEGWRWGRGQEHHHHHRPPSSCLTANGRRARQTFGAKI